ncbi:hypothetical protein HEMROJRC1_19610 [Rodentibacter sp. JRC1]|nr:hypothetical protein HEMROJRC1_19610 [Rodentibacter sp. JRC1]
MKSLGNPILGDKLYGKNTAEIDRTYLHGERLAFEFKREKMELFAMPREGIIWQKESVQHILQDVFGLGGQFNSKAILRNEERSCIMPHNFANKFTIGT